MKQITIAILLTLSNTVFAGEREHNPQQQANSFLVNQNVDVYTKASAAVHAVTTSNSNASSSAQTGSINIDAHQDHDVAASATTTGSSNTTAECWRYDSTSGSLIFAGLTKTLMIRDLVCTLGKPLNDEQKIALCLESSDYRKVREISGKSCSK